jgi:hypothetical protein
MDIMKGARIAAAAAAMLAGFTAAGCDGDDTGSSTTGLRCEGGNLCKMMGECRAANGRNACTAMNNCAGMGYVTATDEADCDAKKAAAAAQAGMMMGS